MTARDKLGKFALEFYRGENCNFMPREGEDIADDASTIQWVLQGWVPENPFIGKQDRILAFGSCFADEVQNYLRDHGYNIPDINRCSITKYGAGMVNTFTLRQQFEWAYEEAGEEHPDDVWHFDPAFPPMQGMKKDKTVTRELFDLANVFIITLGLSEVWYEKESGYVFWKAISSEIYDEKQHGFRNVTVEENKKNLHRIIDIIRKYNSRATVILTLSPVGLKATFRPVSCITANCVSKASLRAAVDEVINERADDNLYYWPSYEIVASSHRYLYEADHRHPKRDTVQQIMRLFGRYFLKEQE
jgi:hypothetical protein